MGQGVCLKDMVAETTSRRVNLTSGVCLADVNDGKVLAPPKTPLQRDIEEILQSAQEMERRIHTGAYTLELFKHGVNAIAGSPRKTAEALRKTIRDQEPKNNKFVA